MKNHNTKSSYIQRIDLKNSYKTTGSKKSETIAADPHDQKECDAATARFLKRFEIVRLLGECGAYKEKGVPIGVIILYIFNLIFSPMSMYCQMNSVNQRTTDPVGNCLCCSIRDCRISLS